MTVPFIFENVYGHECLKETHLPWPKYTGKVRDVYDLGTELLFVCTDRLSAFDRALALIPHKGEVLNQLSAWWFNKTHHLVANHLLKVIAPQAMRVKKCRPLAVEMVVRGYITGTTNTSLWTLYSQGQREFFGVTLPQGLQKNQRLPEPMLTPTSKSKEHDQPLALKDIEYIPNMTPVLWQQMAQAALALFNFATELLAAKGLILVDTKYEFGLDENNRLILIDELHTSDSSRYWDSKDWQEALKTAQEPKNFDKELIRLWYKTHSNPYEDAILPAAPEALVSQVSARYLELFERITGEQIHQGSAADFVVLSQQ
jgi:phosphoribosylaminoimidazole-succinocarboxamide synthase